MPPQGIGANVKIRLYLEGMLIENGCDNVTVSGNVGAPATAQIQLVPTNTIKHILPFTWVHVFTTDPLDINAKGDLSDYKLLFEGVVIARGFTRRDDGRSFVIQCADPSIFWVEARQYWLNVATAGGGLVDQITTATSGGYGTFGTTNATGTFGYAVKLVKLAEHWEDKPEEKFLDTMIAIIDSIGNVNPFYTNARNRFRITDRILRAPAGETEKLFQLALLSDFLDGLAGRQSGQTNLAMVVNQLLTAILHDWVSIPAPPYVEAKIFDRDIFGNIKKTSQTEVVEDARGRKKVKNYQYQLARDHVIGSILFKPDVYTLSPPTCNVIFPNMYDQMAFNENFMGETTRLQMKPQIPQLGDQITQLLMLQRPVELEIFTALIRDPDRQSPKTRTPDGKYADGETQAPTFQDFDWTTNEERIKGIINNAMGLAPAPSTLTMASPGVKQPSGVVDGGIPHYLQNVASYEFFKSKFESRQCSVSGPYNMRAVPGFPILFLDDSAADMNVVAHLMGIVHSVNAGGSATTQYALGYARLVNEVDYNQPKFVGGGVDSKIDTDLLRDANGNYSFESMFNSVNQPPIPEWFDETFRNIRDLDLKYAEWFGPGVGVVQRVLFKEETNPLATAIQATLTANPALVAAAAVEAVDYERMVEQNEKIELSDAVVALNGKYRLARDQGREMTVASIYTSRSFTKIDEAFKFVGAAPLEISDDLGGAQVAGAYSFAKNPANGRVIDYKKMKLSQFVGDVSPGSGYAASNVSSGNDPIDPYAANKMSGAFPVFDTIIHQGADVTDQATRTKLAGNDEEGKPSDWARYDGRPQMYDFEFRLWQESLAAAGYTPTAEKITSNFGQANYKLDENGKTRAATPGEKATGAIAAKLYQTAAAAAKIVSDRLGITSSNDANTMSAGDQAPTGDKLKEGQKKPLPQPLSEKQVVDLRRAIVKAFREELAKSRGFTG